MADAGWVHYPKSESHRAFVARLALELDRVSRPDGGADVDIRFSGEAADRTPSANLLVLGPDSADAMLESVRVGAAGYLPATRSLDEIVRATIAVSCGRAVIPDEMLGALLRQIVEDRRAELRHRERLDALTPRETEVFELAATGLDKFSIGRRLGISPATARTHLSNIMAKLDLDSRAQLVATAAAMGVDTTPREADT